MRNSAVLCSTCSWLPKRTVLHDDFQLGVSVNAACCISQCTLVRFPVFVLSFPSTYIFVVYLSRVWRKMRKFALYILI